MYLIALIPFTIFAFLYSSSFEETLSNPSKLFKPLIAFGILHLVANMLIILTGRFNIFKFIDLSILTGLIDLLLAYLALIALQKIRLKLASTQA